MRKGEIVVEQSKADATADAPAGVTDPAVSMRIVNAYDLWQERYDRVIRNASDIVLKLDRSRIPENKKEKLQWLLHHLRQVVIPRLLQQQPWFWGNLSEEKVMDFLGSCS